MISWSAQNFHNKALPHKNKILLTIGIFWLLLIFFLCQQPIQKSSTAFFPDSSKSLQSMLKAMDMASFSKYIYIDFSSDKLSLSELSNHLEAFNNSLDPKLLKKTTGTKIPEPQQILSLMPALFDEQMEQEIHKRINQEYIKQSLQSTNAVLLGLSTADAINWLRHDPLALRELILHKLPQNQAMPSIDPRFGFALSNNQKHLLLILEPQQSIHQTEFALSAMQDIKNALQKLPTEIKANIVGGVRHTAANTKAIDDDIVWIGIVSLLGLALIYMIFIRSYGGFWLLLTPCLAISLALGMVHLFFGIVSGLAVGFGMSILGIAEDYAVHMHFALRSNNDKNMIFKALSTPLFQGFLLNASGFTLLLFSAIPAIRQLSAFAIVALLSGFILALYILPLCKGFDKPQVKQNQHANHTKAKPRFIPTISLSLILGIICILLFIKLPIDISPQSMGANMKEIQNDSQEFSKTWQLSAPSLILIDEKTSIDALEKTQKIQNILQTHLPSTHFSSLANIIPSNNTITNNITRWNNFILNNKAFIINELSKENTAFNPSQMFAPFFDFLNAKAITPSITTLSAGPLAELMQIFLQDYPNEGQSQSRIMLNEILTSEQLPAEIVDEVTLFSAKGLEDNLRKVFYAEARYIPIMFIFCLVLLYICFRNIAQTCLAAMPALAALFCIFLTMFFWQKPLTLAGLAAMPLVLGLCIDHGIMATHHLAKGIPLQMNKAILVSSLTACVSMGMLAFANHPALQAMGHVIFVGLLIEMPVSIWLLPRLSKQYE